ncbi:MAG: hypothetical protein ACSHW7_05720 [Patiriisocius sp.]|uniref:hypothetical protein n=1 Tax=Patiriisocius sp. TaxID=2822396 RepID=UPI003EFB252E
MESPLRKKINLDFVQIELYDKFLISTIKEGVVFEKQHLHTFYEIFDNYFPNRPFGYIANREFDYTVNPTCYLQPSDFPNLRGIAICCRNESSAAIAKFEKKFYQRPMEIFFDIESSKNWVEKIIS